MEWKAGIIGAIIGALITFVASCLTLRFNYKQLFAKTVSSTREKWLCIFRENLSKFLACAEILNGDEFIEGDKDSNDNNACRKSEYKKEFYETRGMIVSRLNMDEELHVLMFASINQIDCEKKDLVFVAKREYIYDVARKLMKEEWQRVKDEARGKRK